MLEKYNNIIYTRTRVSPSAVNLNIAERITYALNYNIIFLYLLDRTSNIFYTLN